MTFGMYTGRTPFPGIRSDGYHAKAATLLREYYQPILDDSEMLEKLEKRGKWPSKDIAAFFGTANQRWNTRLTTSADDAELLMRHEMQAV